MIERKRISGLDVVRTVAVLFVISVHFFMYTGYYSKPFYGELLYIQTAMRWLFYTCVPLFIILTGYLKSNKEPNKEHYKSIIHIIVSYLFASIVVLLFRKLYLADEKTIFELVLGIFNFTTVPYAWYIEMYIGLFLLIPFLNIIYNNLKDKKQKQLLLLTFFFLTSISTIGHGVNVNNISILNILPDWWSYTLYPIMYYFIGCYIKEFQPKIPKCKNIFFIILILLIQTTLTFGLTYGAIFDSNLWNFYGNIFTALLSVLIFVLLYKINIKNKRINFIFKDISKLSLDIYLLSYIGDLLLYDFIVQYVTDYRYYIFLFFIIVPIIFIFDYILANVKRGVVKFSSFIIKKIRKK